MDQEERIGGQMKLSKEERITLAIWGCPDYGFTIQRLTEVALFTVHSRVKRILVNLRDRLFMECTADEYAGLYEQAVRMGENEMIRQLSDRDEQSKKIRKALETARSRGWKVLEFGNGCMDTGRPAST